MTTTPARPDAPAPTRGRFAFLLSPGWIAAILGAVAFAMTCFLLLAPWQFARHTERAAQNAAITAALAAQPVPVEDLMNAAGQPPQGALWRVVTATGTFDGERQVQVRLRQDSNGNPVSEVITPFRLDSGQLLLVDRGYVRFADVRNGVPIADPPAGRVTITGRVQAEQVDPLNRQPLAVEDRIEAYAINVGAVTSPATGGPVPDAEFLQGYVQLTGESPGVLTPIELPQTDAGPFLSYALQWEAFGVIALIGMGIFVYREVATPRPPDDHVDKRGDGGPRSRERFDRSRLYDQ